MNRWLERDEREVVVDLDADRLSYLVLAFGLLAVVAYRGFVDREASWELLGLVIASGVAGTLVRAWRGTISRRWLVPIAVTMAIAVVVAALLAVTIRG